MMPALVCPEVKVGLPSVIEASLLPPTVGLGRARRLILTGETIDAATALSIGLIDEIVPARRLQDAALGLARGFLNMSRLSACHPEAGRVAVAGTWGG